MIRMQASTGTKPRVAVVTPCFNDGATLRETVESVRKLDNVEHVVVDDQSTDPATLAILEELEAEGVHVLHQEHQGPSAARTRALASTTAEYVFPLDADDLALRDGVAALIRALDNHPNAMLAWGDLQCFGHSVRLLHSPDRLDPWLITHVNPIPYASLMRREALEQVGGWGDVSGFEDWDVWMGFVERGFGGVHVPQPVIRYRIHGGRRWQGNAQRHDQIHRELAQRHPTLLAARRVNRRHSPSPTAWKVLLPAIEVLPLPSRAKVRLRGLVVRR
jgi:glycosyltransferase involved in cell wall biosynthesis